MNRRIVGYPIWGWLFLAVVVGLVLFQAFGPGGAPCENSRNYDECIERRAERDY